MNGFAPGSILACDFMSSGFLSNRLAFPVLAYTLLSSDVDIRDTIIDFVSTYENSNFMKLAEEFMVLQSEVAWLMEPCSD